MFTRVVDQYQFDGPVRFLLLPNKNIVALVGTTPSVGENEFFTLSGAVTTVTNFLGGKNPQHIRLLGDGTTTIANNAQIKTNTGANKLLVLNKVYQFFYINDVWYEAA